MRSPFLIRITYQYSRKMHIFFFGVYSLFDETHLSVSRVFNETKYIRKFSHLGSVCCSGYQLREHAEGRRAHYGVTQPQEQVRRNSDCLFLIAFCACLLIYDCLQFFFVRMCILFSIFNQTFFPFIHFFTSCRAENVLYIYKILPFILLSVCSSGTTSCTAIIGPL